MTAFLSLTSEQYKRMIGTQAKRSKYGNRRSGSDDSQLEKKYAAQLEWARVHPEAAHRVVNVERKTRYLLIPKQEGERAVHYEADFVVTYADGRIEVVDTKSEPTRKNRLYVVKRKLMLDRHNIRLVEVMA